MKFLAAVALLTLSVQSFAGVVRVVATGDCTSTVPLTLSAEVQKSALTECAEQEALKNLSDKCERTGQGWLLDAGIAKRGYKTAQEGEGRTMNVSAMAVGRCEF